MILEWQIARVLRKLQIVEPLVWVAIPVAQSIARRMMRSSLVYQRTDKFEEMPLVDYDSAMHDDECLKQEADLTVYVNTALYTQERLQCRKAIFLDHGVDYDMFLAAEHNSRVPPDIEAIPKPIAGYIGTVEDIKMDIKFLNALIDRLPDVSFVFVGKVDSGFTCLKKKHNVWFLGHKSYEEVPLYGKRFDVSILPWRHSKWSEAANPVKLKEYLALGRPVVSTPAFSEIDEYRDVISVAESAEDFAACIQAAISKDSTYLAILMRERIRTATWDAKVAMVLAELGGGSLCAE
jgi:glycosyltransferase involved in cell wall biosynthesis